MAEMTASARAFQRQGRLISHKLQIFLHLEELELNDPRDLYGSLHSLIEETVRVRHLKQTVVISNRLFSLFLSN